MIISESRGQCQRYSETFIHTLLALAEGYSNLPEIHLAQPRSRQRE